MTYPSPHPRPPQGHGGSPSSPYAAYGQHSVSAPPTGVPYGQAPVPAGYVSRMDPEQLAIPTQSVPRSPGAPASLGRPSLSPPAQTLAPQCLSGPAGTPQYQFYQQPYADSRGYPSEEVTAPGYSTGGRRPLLGDPGAEATSPQPLGTKHPMPWRGEKITALILMLVACGLELVIYVTFILSLSTDGGRLQIALLTLMFITVTPAVWSHYFGLRHLFLNQPVSEMVGLSLWFGLGSLTLTSGTASDPYNDLHNVIVVLLFAVCTICATLTVRLNQRLKDPQPWTVTLALGSCQFILLNSILRLAELYILAYTTISQGQSISQYTSNAWFAWSSSGGSGLPLVPGLIFSVSIMSLAAAGLFLGTRSPRNRGFMVTSVSASILLTLHNLLVFVIYGLPTSGQYSYKPSDTPIEVLAATLIGAALIGSTWLAGHHPLAVPPTGRNPSLDVPHLSRY